LFNAFGSPVLSSVNTQEIVFRFQRLQILREKLSPQNVPEMFVSFSKQITARGKVTMLEVVKTENYLEKKFEYHPTK
jgi:hypothetical protein